MGTEKELSDCTLWYGLLSTPVLSRIFDSDPTKAGRLVTRKCGFSVNTPAKIHVFLKTDYSGI